MGWGLMQGGMEFGEREDCRGSYGSGGKDKQQLPNPGKPMPGGFWFCGGIEFDQSGIELGRQRGLGCELGIDLFERGDIAPPRNVYAPLFQGALDRKILRQPEPKPARVGTDDVVDLRVVTRRAFKDCFSDGSFIKAGVIPQQSLSADVEEERGQAGGIKEAATGCYPLDE